jgi:hypothetical protein
MKRIYVLIFVFATIAFPAIKSQTVAVKTNLLYDVTTTINMGLEIGLSSKWSLDLPVNYNPWQFDANSKLRHWMIQPEARYWLCQRFFGGFVGLHGHVGAFNIGGIKGTGLEDYRYEGDFYGAGLSYGYHWILNSRWSVEATIGVGYAFLNYTKYECEKCAKKLKDDTRDYLGPTKAGVSLIYIIK